MTKILVLGSVVLAVAPQETNEDWKSPEIIVPKRVAPDAKLVEAELPKDFHFATHEWVDGKVVRKAAPGSQADLVPARVTRRQARQALLLAGLLDKVQPAIDSIMDPVQRGLAQIEWDDSQEFERQRPLVRAIGVLLGLDSAALDTLFVTAADL